MILECYSPFYIKTNANLLKSKLHLKDRCSIESVKFSNIYNI